MDRRLSLLSTGWSGNSGSNIFVSRFLIISTNWINLLIITILLRDIISSWNWYFLNPHFIPIGAALTRIINSSVSLRNHRYCKFPRTTKPGVLQPGVPRHHIISYTQSDHRFPECHVHPYIRLAGEIACRNLQPTFDWLCDPKNFRRCTILEKINCMFHRPTIEPGHQTKILLGKPRLENRNPTQNRRRDTDYMEILTKFKVFEYSSEFS